jgi:hypothetical protein
MVYSLCHSAALSVIPAEAGIQSLWFFWTPAFAGVTAFYEAVITGFEL